MIRKFGLSPTVCAVLSFFSPIHTVPTKRHNNRSRFTLKQITTFVLFKLRKIVAYLILSPIKISVSDLLYTKSIIQSFKIETPR
jgi:hypothetical protein